MIQKRRAGHREPRYFEVRHESRQSPYRNPTTLQAIALREAEGHLDKVYRSALEDRSDTARAKLRTAERAWLIYRDAECAWQASLYEGGTLAPVSYGQCLVDLTRERIKAIEASKQP